MATDNATDTERAPLALSRRAFLQALFAVSAAGVLSACSLPGEAGSNAGTAASSALIEPYLATVYDSAREESPAKTITLMMVGDMLIHTSVWNTGLRADGSYNFDHFFTHMADEFSGADISIVNQETILGGTEHGLETFPYFNSPQELGDAEVAAGVDVALSATNHALDHGFEGIQWDLSYWRAKHPEVVVPGIADSQELADTIQMVERNGIKVALLNYTDHTNSIPIPSEAPYCVKVLGNCDLAGDVQRAREAGADFVIAFPHWGTEYVYTPDSGQLRDGQTFVDAGVDAIIGTHPHVIENVDVYEGPDGKKVPIFWSLGNYVSGQIEKPRMLGGMAKLTLQKTEAADGSTTSKVIEYSMTPVVTHRATDTSMGVYKLSEYTDDLASVNTIRNADGCSDFTVQYLKDLAAQVLGEKYDADACVLQEMLV